MSLQHGIHRHLGYIRWLSFSFSFHVLSACLKLLSPGVLLQRFCVPMAIGRGLSLCTESVHVYGVCAQDHRLVRCSACMFVSSPPSDGKAAKVRSTTFAVASGLDCRLTFTKGHRLCSAHRCSSAPSPAESKTSVNGHS